MYFVTILTSLYVFLQAAADVDSTRLDLINLPGGGHLSKRVEEVPLGYPMVEPPATDAVEAAMRGRARADLDTLEAMSRQTRVTRLGAKAIGVSVPVQPSADTRSVCPKGDHATFEMLGCLVGVQ
jgi:HrpA-like RNA helicase